MVFGLQLSTLNFDVSFIESLLSYVHMHSFPFFGDNWIDFKKKFHSFGLILLVNIFYFVGVFSKQGFR